MHKHRWKILKWDGDPSNAVAICISKFNCTAMLTDKEVERRLNAVEFLNAKDAENEQPDLIEKLADLEHERWSSWMRYMFANWTEENISRWKQQMVTSYADLPEYSKKSDRKEARKTMEIVGPVIAQLEAVKATSIALYCKIENSPDVCNLDEFDEWENALTEVENVAK